MDNNADGSDKRLLTTVTKGFIERMVWNPDGSRIAVVTLVLGKTDDNGDIYMFNVTENAKVKE